ncbi:hypothetical protein ACFP2G_00590 [Psittacicella hinzii]
MFRGKYYEYRQELAQRQATLAFQKDLTYRLIDKVDKYIFIASGTKNNSICFIVSPYDGSVFLGNVLGAAQQTDKNGCGSVFYIPYISYNLAPRYLTMFNHVKYLLEAGQDRRFDYLDEDFKNGPRAYSFRTQEHSPTFDFLKEVFAPAKLESNYQFPIYIKYQPNNEAVVWHWGQRALLELQVQQP